MTTFDLRTVALFEKLPEDDLARLEASLTECVLENGDTLFDEGDVGDKAYIITSGEIEILKTAGDRQVRIAVLEEGVIIGEMALLTGEARNATARAASDVDLVSIPRESFNHLLATSAPASRALFDVFLQRWREQEDRLRQSERMAQIGVLTAGLAHEMNNPAAAVTRGAEQLGPAIQRYVAAARELPTGAAAPFSLSERERPTLSGMDRSDREADLEDALDDAGVSDGWEYTSALIESGFTAADMEDVPSEHAEAIIKLMAAEADAMSLRAEVDEGAKRLSELVGALKSYSFLDQAPVQEVDLPKGIEDTLLILKSKTRDITIERDYAAAAGDGTPPPSASKFIESEVREHRGQKQGRRPGPPWLTVFMRRISERLERDERVIEICEPDASNNHSG